MPLQVVDRTSVALRMTTSVTHFSTVVFENGAVHSIQTVVPPRDAFSGQPIDVRYQLTPQLMGEDHYRNLPTSFPSPSYDVTWNSVTWDSVHNAAFGGPNVTPTTGTAPDLTALTNPSRFFDFTFTCNAPGPYGIQFQGGVNVPAHFVYQPEPGDLTCSFGGHCCFSGAAWICGGACTTTADCTGMTEVTLDGPRGNVQLGDPGTANCLMPHTDATGDFVDSISTNTPALTVPQVDLVAYGFTFAMYTQAQVDAAFNGADSPYACGQSDAARTVACSDGSTAMAAGQIDTFFMKLAGPVPISDATRRYIYSLVLDSDGDLTNNWQAQAPYDYDYFQGADRWYEFTSSAGTVNVTTTQVDATQATTTIPSGARAVVNGDAITWFVPASELPSPTGYRVTAYGDDGMYTPSSRGGDVSGPDPTSAFATIP